MWLLALLVCSAGSAWLGYRLGGEWLARTALPGARPCAESAESAAASAEERSALLRELEVLRGAREVDRQSVRTLKEEIQGLQEQLMRQEQELEVLRGVVAKGGDGPALRVTNFALSAAEDGPSYRVKFTVSQVKKDFGFSEGQIRVQVLGELEGETQVLGLADLTEDGTDDLRMRFRHFQNVEEVIVLPSGFVPREALVDVTPTNEELEPLSLAFAWDLLAR